MIAVLVISLITLVFIYIGYPISMWLAGKFVSRKHSVTPPDKPKVTIIIPAFNEEKCIRENIENKLNQNYPQDKLQIIVVSDDSTDDTNNIVSEFASKYPDKVELINQIPRQGKTAGVNKAVKKATGSILVFADANSIFDIDAITQLVKTFDDQDVGYVTGKMVYTHSDGSLVGDGCSAYMKYENHLRVLESNMGSIVGVDGGVDAMRKELFTELRPDQLPDFVQPLSVVKQGYRVVYNSEALLKEEALEENKSEFRMRVRVSLRAYWALLDMKILFNPLQFGLFSYQLFSHKALRYLAFIPQIAAFVSNAALMNEGFVFTALFIGQIVFYLLAFYGHINQSSSNKLVKLSYYLCLVNLAAMIAFFQFVRGKKIVIWKPRVG